MNHANKISELEAENVDLKETVIIHAADLHNKTAKFNKEKDVTIKFLESQCMHWKNEFEKEIKLNMKMEKKLEDLESKLVESAFLEPGKMNLLSSQTTPTTVLTSQPPIPTPTTCSAHRANLTQP